MTRPKPEDIQNAYRVQETSGLNPGLNPEPGISSVEEVLAVLSSRYSAYMRISFGDEEIEHIYQHLKNPIVYSIWAASMNAWHEKHSKIGTAVSTGFQQDGGLRSHLRMDFEKFMNEYHEIKSREQRLIAKIKERHQRESNSILSYKSCLKWIK